MTSTLPRLRRWEPWPLRSISSFRLLRQQLTREHLTGRRGSALSVSWLRREPLPRRSLLRTLQFVLS
eukprot:1342447-Rhodomonas_salina.1